MTVNEIIDFYYRTNTVDFDTYETTPEYIKVFSKNLHDSYYNHLVPVGNTDSIKLLEFFEFKKYDRAPVVCVLPLSDDYSKNDMGLKNIANDSWLRFTGVVPPKKETVLDFDLKTVGVEQMDDYVDLFMAGFSGGVYGTLPAEYAVVEKLCFLEMATNPGKHLIAMAYYKKKPVGVVRAILESDKAFIYAFAIPKAYRFSGVTAKLLGAFILNELFDRGIKHIFLQTEADTVLEKFYKMNGFERLFLGKYYTKAE